MFALALPCAALALGLSSRAPVETEAMAAVPLAMDAVPPPIEPPAARYSTPLYALAPEAHQPVIDLDQPLPPTPPDLVSVPPRDLQPLWRELVVAEGDSLSALFERHGLGAEHWLPLSRLDGDGKRLRRLHPGDRLHLRLDEQGVIAELKVRIDDTRTLQLQREGRRYAQNTIRDRLEHRERNAIGSINSSLFLAGRDAGLSDRLIMELAGIFAWDIDFALDIRSGDRFTVLYEDLYREGERLREGDIQAAEFVVRGKTYRAVRYVDEQGRAGYYAPDGRPMKKTFIRTPVEFTRISSRFSLGRKHPILNRIRAHKGVDYAAPRGTPIKAAGAGKVVHAGRKGGYGNTVIIQHGGKYTTLYAHLKSFSRGIRNGASVSQGQTIGYVGSTGLATGPHLHYEFRVHGKHVDPLSVKLPAADPIAASRLPAFRNSTAPLLARLEALSGTVVATR